MRCLVLIAVVITGTVARPETYREKEDFQYSRSSTDEGSKSGYYGAQRGNMGGNYERAHNMDSLAQHQMSGLIHQVEGEIGDTSKTNTGSVYTAANSRGMYGSGHYDLSNLEGRNFQEGTSYGGSHSQSALTNSAYRHHASGSNAFSNSNSYSHSSRHSSLDRSEHEQREEVQSSNLRSGEAAYQQEHGAYGGSLSHGNSWSPYENRLVSTKPMRILVRPGSKVTVPLATQTYDTDHSAASYDASAYNHNAAKSDAEVIINNDHETNHRQIPTSKHYESSYSYRKEWEKHHSSPGAVPLGVDIDSSIPKTSELYDDSTHTQTYNNRHQYASNAADSHSQNHQSRNYDYNNRNNLAFSSQSKHQSDYDVQRERLSSDALTLNTKQSNLNQDYVNQQESLNSKPKSYQSSYSYHKSWERQGDPYVIVPVPGVQDGQAPQRLSGYSSYQHGSKNKQSHQSYTSSNGFLDCDCDDEGHIRVARSYNTDQEVQQQQNGWEDFGQESQNLWDGQQTQYQGDRTEDFGQQTQTNFDKIEDLGQQTQNQWDQIDDGQQQTQNHWDKIEDIGQQTQNHFDKIEDLGQQTQKHWDKIEELGQQTQTNFDKIEDLGQQSQKDHWDQSLNLEQQSQNQFDKIEDLGQHSQNQWNQYNNFDQQSQSIVGQEQATWNKIEKSNEDNINNHEIYREHSYSNSNTYVDNVTHYTDKQAESDHEQNPAEHQNYFYTHLSNDFHKQQDESLSDLRTQHSSSINSLWDKLDRLSGVSTFNSDHNTKEYTSFTNNEHSSNYSNKSTTTENVLITDKNLVLPKDLGRGDIPDIPAVNPKNIGRGDIPDTPKGLELLNHFNTEKVNVVSTTASGFDKRNTTEYGTLNDIEALSLTENHKEITEKPKGKTDKTNMDIEMDIMNQQIAHSNKSHYVNHNFQNKQVLEGKDRESEHSYEEQHIRSTNTNENNNKHLGQQILDLSKINENSNKNNQYNHYGGFDQQSETLNQHNEEQETQNNEKPVNIIDQQSLDQNLDIINEWNENIDENGTNHEHFGETNPQTVEQETQHFENPVEIEDQQNLEQSLVDFSKWNENLDQHSMNHHLEGFDQQNQQNMEQELQSFDKSGDMFDQQIFNQNSIDSSLFSENPYPQNIQKSESFNPDSDNLNQKNIEGELQQNTNGNYNPQSRDYGFDPPNENFHQQEQNTVDFSQFNENYAQQSMSQNFERLDKQREKLEHQNMGQESQNYDKPDEIFDQQNLNQYLNDFSQFNEKFDQQHKNHGSQDISKSTDSFDQNFNTHGLQHQNYDQQFGTRRENYEQNMEQRFTSSAPLSEIVNTQVAENNIENLETQHSIILTTQQNVQHADSQATLQTEPEQTGFWASVGKKFTNAKDKLSSWFRRKSD